MRSVPCVRSWRSLDLPFDDGFCLPFGIPSQKGGVFFDLSTYRVFVFGGRTFFCVLELVEIILYLGASICIYLFSLFLFCWAIMIGGDTFIVLYVSCFNCLLIYI